MFSKNVFLYREILCAKHSTRVVSVRTRKMPLFEFGEHEAGAVCKMMKGLETGANFS